MAPLVGREGTLSVLGGHLDAAARGAGGCVVVEGPLGIGRSRLLQATAREGAERGLTVVSGRAGANGGTPAGGGTPAHRGVAGGGGQPLPVHLLLNYLRRVLSADVDVDDLVRPDGNPFRLMDQVGELVEIAARRHPVVVLLDDVHLVDDLGGLALRGLVQSLAESPVLWLLTRRSVAARSLAQHAVDRLIDGAAVRLHLGALDNEAVAELCTGLLGAKPDSSVLDWAARCGGNPWLLASVFDALVTAGRVVFVDGTAAALGERLPDDVLGVVRGLLDELPAAVGRLLVAGAGVGAEFTAAQAAAALGGHGDAAGAPVAGVDEAVRTGLLQRHGEELAFAHGVIAEALRHPDFRRPEPAAAALPAAAPAPAGTAEAVRDGHREQPYPVPPEDSPAAPQRPGCGCTGLVAASVAALAERSDAAPRTLARALRLLAGAGRTAEAARLAEVAVRAGVDVPDVPDATADPARPVTRLPSPAAGRPDGTVAAHCEVCARPLWTWLVRALVAADAFEEATAVCDAVRQEAGRRGGPWAAGLWHGHRAELMAAAGRLEEARAEAGTALGLADRTPPEDLLPARLVLARISMHCGDLATASQQLRMAERPAGAAAAAAQPRLDWALAQFHAASGRAAMTVRSLLDAEQGAAPEPLLFAEAPTAAATLVRLAGQTGLGEEAAQAAGFARRLAAANPEVTSLAAGAAHADGVLHDDLDALRRAAELYRLAGRPLAAAGALEDAARGNGAGDGAARLLAAAADLYLECGAQRDTARVQRKLRRLGVPHARAALGTQKPKSGWESLTGAELRVVRAVVDGRTNREAAGELFLSPHTVDSHLRRVFAKLDINSRVELTKQFLAHEAAAPGGPAASRQLAAAGPEPRLSSVRE
ncbi:helix-turn-helix transcriptional regulator [Streptomyces sp. CMB-StM0423]|uniref:helix-turn-helix transcriptional regulator n=1 Tax=Streptomyces sp. CMB-StM0423 TaxID=2059884 RepID=UPI000C7151EF|nr:LuxR family transcriptional regulator [Streptomyces sp. CMB-StM0423]AUH39959.1 helix-turn-helix transcriptional regulator [Streptomyces sp. CMB-StM0423]